MKVDFFYDCLTHKGIDYFCGVPDSLLKDLCAYIDNKSSRNVVTANEGNAIALACGYYMASAKIAAVYMQNSGLGNAINPLVSLSDNEVYNIPLLLIIGLRGEEGIQDEPQHIKQGKITGKLLDVLEIKYTIISSETSNEAFQKIIKDAFSYMQDTEKPFALLVRKGTFEKFERSILPNNFEITRKDAITYITEHTGKNDVIVSTTGFISRELYQYRENTNAGHKQDFLTIGSMGHASTIAAAIAMAKPHKKVFCYDGDGAYLMHMGAIPVIASCNAKNFRHIVFNNNAHDSVGGQPNASKMIDFTQMALSCGYRYAYSVRTMRELTEKLPLFLDEHGPSLLEIKIKCEITNDLIRPKEKPAENKKSFMVYLKDNVYIGKNSITILPELLQGHKKILAFTAKKSFEHIHSLFDGFFKDKDIKIRLYSDFSNNPNDFDMNKAFDVLHEPYDLIIAAGGGSVIDFAKIFRYKKNLDIPLIAIPTTAGTGSETTKFAVFYINGKKHSLEDERILPDYVIVDSQFLSGSPRYLKACTGFDAYAQAIESFWSINSTEESRGYAIQSIMLCKENLVNYVNSNNEIAAENMALAAYFSGKAINISKTTAPHALSYIFTSKYGIPHGHAVALSFAGIFEMNLRAAPENLNDTRGIGFVQTIMNKLETLFTGNYFDRLFQEIGLETNINSLGIYDITGIVNGINFERLSNNPRKFEREELENIFKEPLKI